MSTKNKPSAKIYIDTAIRTVSEVGMDKATVKVMSENVNRSQGSIYRHFPGKKQLLMDAFNLTDQKIMKELGEAVEFKGRNMETLTHNLILSGLQILVGTKDETMFYIRYRYSSEYEEDVEQEHLNRCTLTAVTLQEKYEFLKQYPLESLKTQIDTSLGTALLLAERVLTDRPIPSDYKI